MAISDLLTKLADDVRDSYDAVEEKGGTLPEHKNTDSLSDAIRSIEGGGEDPGDWGLVYYWPKTKLTIENISGDNCTATIVDEDLFKQVVESMGRGGQFNLDFNFQQGEGWRCWELSEEPMSTADLLNYGIEVTDFDEETAEYAMIMIMGSIEIDKTVPIAKLQVQNEAEFLRLRNPGYIGESFETLVPLGQIQKYIIGRAVTELPNGFMSNGEGGVLEAIDTTYAQNVTTIGNEVFSFGSGCYVTCNMSFPSVTSIGKNFMTNTYFAGTMDLPEVKTIGDDFGRLWLQLPSMPKVETIGKNFMSYSEVRYFSLGSFPKIKTIGEFAFAYSQINRLELGWKKYNPDLQSIGKGLCHKCLFLNEVRTDSGMVGVLTADTGDQNVSFGAQGPNARYPLYSFGVLLDELGTGTRSAMLAKFPAKDNTDGYRKWRYSS